MVRSEELQTSNLDSFEVVNSNVTIDIAIGCESDK